MDIYARRQLVHEARHIQGSLSALLALEKTDLTVSKIREVANDIYNKTDNFLTLLDEIESNQSFVHPSAKS